MSASTTHEAGREWLGAVRHESSTSFTRLNFSSVVQRQLAGEPAASSPLLLSPPYLSGRHQHAILVAQHPKFSGATPAQSVRTKQAKPLVVDGFYWLFVRYSRPDQLINVLNCLDLCLDNTHRSSH